MLNKLIENIKKDWNYRIGIAFFSAVILFAILVMFLLPLVKPTSPHWVQVAVIVFLMGYLGILIFSFYFALELKFGGAKNAFNKNRANLNKQRCCENCEKELVKDEIIEIVDVESQTELEICGDCFVNKFGGHRVHGKKTSLDIVNSHIQEILNCKGNKNKIKTALLCFAVEISDYDRLKAKYKFNFD